MTSPLASPAPSAPIRWPWIAAALGAGLVVGWLDRTATSSQGPLLLLMAVAFLLTIPRAAPAWAIALATFAGLPLAHVVGRALGDQAGASWGMVIALAPVGIAAAVGTGTGALVRSASALVDRRAAVGIVLAGCTVVGAGPVYATLIARGQPFAWWIVILWQLVSLVAWAVATPALLRAWQRLRSGGRATPHSLLIHAAAVLTITLLHSIALPIGTRALFVPLGPAGVPAAMAWAFAGYLPLDLLTYGAVMVAAYAADVDRRAHALATREAAARGELAVARFAGLRAQLRPHFLFNALNTASVMATRGDTEGTRRVLSGLGDLLRYVMRDTNAPNAESPGSPGAAGMVMVREEIAFVEQYLAIERERFPERLRTTVDVAPDVADAKVPALLLQPLVENAIKHGVGGRIGAGVVTIRAWRDGGSLRVTVTDDGPGPAPNADHGVGLANTRARLTVLYGGAASLSLQSAPGGGAIAAVAIPFER